jgi:hypothetical protein
MEDIMGWYALYKWFIQFRRIPYINYINWYRKFLYEEWFRSLSNKEQEAELIRQQELKEKKKKDSEMVLARLWLMHDMLDRLLGGK